MRPTAMPQATRPARMNTWDCDSAIMLQPHSNGIIERSSVFFRPYASIIGTDTSDPIGVASECIDAIAREVRENRKEGCNYGACCNLTLYY
jgi:hypothetical protein